MPYTPPTTAPILTANLVATGMLGMGTPRYALGIAIGVSLWLPQVVVATTDVGSLGVGKGLLPFVVPQPLLLSFLTESFASVGLLGPMAPLKILGLANGLAVTLPMAFITTTHPSVGTGTGVAKFTSPPPMPSLLAGFAQAGIVGPSVPQVVTAIGLGLMKAVTAFTIPVPIVGAASPVGSGGVGAGKVL